MHPKLLSQLSKYGFKETESRIYLHLLSQSHELSVLQIARALKLGRTPVYNALDRLEQKGVVQKVISATGYNYSANNPDTLERYWRKKERTVSALGQNLPGLVNSLEGLGVDSGYKSNVKYYSGRSGLEQITYNSLRAQGHMYIYEVATDITFFPSKAASESFRQRLVDNEITVHQLTNHTSFEPFTEVEALVADYWDIKYIDPSILKIDFEMLIYSDVCAMYSVSGKDIFGIEIYNTNLASMQIQIFKAMQHLAKTLTKNGTNGAASLKPRPAK